MRIQLAQVNPVTGDIEGNVEKVRSCLREAGGMGVDLTIFPECMISGFPAGGLLECPEFLRQCEEAVNNLARQIKGIAVIVGVPLRREGERAGNNGSCSRHGVVNSPRERRWGPGWGALRWPESGGGRFRIRGGQRERSGVGFRLGGYSAGGGILAAGRRDVPGWK